VMTTHYARFGIENVIDALYIKGYILIGFYRDKRTARIAFDGKISCLDFQLILAFLFL